jgi:alpha-beta hydrolase superfamily lysophospholipase
MVPVTFAGCFGWFHPPAAPGRDVAALLCPGLGQDGSTGYRSFRLLADRLAAAGYPALRFDYPGTGDSCDTDAADLWTAWLDSIDRALDWLAAQAGTRRVVLFGLRIGALLAAQAAARRGDAAGLGLFAPVPRGRSYLSQLAVEARLRGGGAADGSLTAGELRLSRETQLHLRAADLAATAIAPACRVALWPADDTPALAAAVDAWRARGVAVAAADFAGLEALLRPTQQADEAPPDFTGVMAWLREALPGGRRAAVPPLPAAAVLTPQGCIEHALRFGGDGASGDGHLCGILCRPAGDAPPDLAVVIANAGGNPHHGVARFSVELARRLARAGIASLRLDFAGLGDSRNSDGDDGPTDVFGVDRCGDMRAAIDRLEELGYRRFAAFGHCSGAYHALQAGLAETRFGTLLLVNLPWFTLRHETPGPASVARRSLAALAHSATRVLFLFSAGDAGLRQFERHFGPRGATLGIDADGNGAFAVTIGADWDHDLMQAGMREEAGRHLLHFLAAQPALPVPA